MLAIHHLFRCIYLSFIFEVKSHFRRFRRWRKFKCRQVWMLFIRQDTSMCVDWSKTTLQPLRICFWTYRLWGLFLANFCFFNFRFRESALNLIGLMCHECINITFLKRENQQTGKFSNGNESILNPNFRFTGCSSGSPSYSLLWTLAHNFDPIRLEKASIHTSKGTFFCLILKLGMQFLVAPLSLQRNFSTQPRTNHR